MALDKRYHAIVKKIITERIRVKSSREKNDKGIWERKFAMKVSNHKRFVIIEALGGMKLILSIPAKSAHSEKCCFLGLCHIIS